MRFYEILADFMNFRNFMRCERPAISDVNYVNKEY